MQKTCYATSTSCQWQLRNDSICIIPGDEAESDDESDDVDELTKRMREIGLSNVQGIICPEWRNEM